MNLSEDEKALYTELVVQIAFRMCDSSYYTEGRLSREERPDFLGCVIQRGATSCLEGGSGVLYAIGVTQPLNLDLTPKKEEPHLAPCYRLMFGVAELRQHLAGVLPISAPPLSEVVEAFLALICGYNYGIHSRRETFSVPPDFERLFDLFERCGYVERAGDKVGWTDKIAPEMRAAYEWNDDLISYSEAEEAALEKGWQTMPPRLRKALDTNPPMDYRTLLLVVRQCWNGSEWVGVNPEGGVFEDTGEYVCLTDQDIRMAQYLERKFRTERG